MIRMLIIGHLMQEETETAGMQHTLIRKIIDHSNADFTTMLIYCKQTRKGGGGGGSWTSSKIKHEE